MIQPPQHLAAAGIVGASIRHKWSDDIAADLAEAENQRLQTAIQKTHFKGAMAFSAGLAEWIIWRFKGAADITMPLQRIEAAWAVAIDSSLALELDPIDDEFNGPVQGPISLCLDLLGTISEQCKQHVASIDERVVALAMLARHVVPARSEFDDWVKQALKRLAKAYPMDISHFDSATEIYDDAYEQAVPREALQSDLTAAQAQAAVDSAKAELQVSNNPFVHRP